MSLPEHPTKMYIILPDCSAAHLKIIRRHTKDDSILKFVIPVLVRTFDFQKREVSALM